MTFGTRMSIIRWPRDTVDPLAIPQEARDYLINEGLPEFVDNPRMEFGIYESDRDLVIGQSGDCPVVLRIPDGEIVIENPTGHRMHVNRSVSHLGRFLGIWLDSASIVEARSMLETLAPESVESGNSCFWGQVLDYESVIDDSGQID